MRLLSLGSAAPLTPLSWQRMLMYGRTFEEPQLPTESLLVLYVLTGSRYIPAPYYSLKQKKNKLFRARSEAEARGA